MDNTKNNKRYYDKFRSVPESAKKKIGAGKLKGFTNINPQWRIEVLTEMFGPAGIGWVIENVRYWTTEGVSECAMWCSLDLRVKVDGEWSNPINGIGGSKLYGKGQGDGINDEACKMAQTDAISVACKNLGIAADVYMGVDDTKYRGEVQNFAWATPPGVPAPPAPPTPAPMPQAPANLPAPGTEIDHIVQLFVNAKSGDELKALWSQYKTIYGKNARVKEAIKNNPFNPNKR